MLLWQFLVELGRGILLNLLHITAQAGTLSLRQRGGHSMSCYMISIINLMAQHGKLPQ